MTKKILSLIVAVVVLLSVFSFSSSKVQAAGIINYAGGNFVWGKGIAFVFDASGYRNRDVKDGAIFVGSNFHDLGCTVNREGSKIICVARGGLAEYAGETGIIYLAGQVFYVTIPGITIRLGGGGEENEEDEESMCAEPSVLGANVKFTDIDGIHTTEFIAGDSLAEVRASAAEMLAEDPDLVSYEVVGDLDCGTEAPEEVPL
ncbi:MAG TPA: hypothetical protein VK206_18005 [Anaerolineales bacterium]|nr:hypothetical protein [Anaerolineales bacterium]